MDKPVFTVECGIVRLVLPREVQQMMNCDEKATVEIWLHSVQDAVIIKRHAVVCAFCGRTGDLKPFRHSAIFPECQKDIMCL